MNLLINIATRGRPELLLDTLTRTLPNIRHANTRVMVSVDDDDKATLEVAERCQQVFDKLMFSVKPREDSLGEKYNRMLATPADVYLAMVDYAPHITPGFDVKILEAAAVYPDRLCYVFNQLANLSFPQINAATAQMVEKVGYFYPPYFPYWFVDHWLDDIARMTERFVYADVVTDNVKRANTMEFREINFWSTLFDASYLTRERLSASIISYLDETPAKKAALIRNFPLVRQHSLMINNNARAQFSTQPDAPWDDRYRRIRARAVEAYKGFIAELEAREKNAA